MIILVYIESLKTFTSGMPHRGVLIELISLRKYDEFILVLRKGVLSSHMEELFSELKNFSNWKLVYENRSRKIVNLLALLHYKNHSNIKIKADVYLSFDAECLGTKNHPQIITLHDLSSVRNTDASSLSYIKRLARKFTIENGVQNADKIVSISDFTKKDILDYFDIDNKKVMTIHNGIDSKWFKKNDYSFQSHESYWIWWGAFSKRKNLNRLLKAYEMLLQEKQVEIDNIPSLYLIGNSNEYSQSLSVYIASSNILQKKVKFFSQKEFQDLKSFVANSKGLLFPSLYEGFGLPVIEAYSQGIAVLTSNVSSLPEISGGLGVLVNPKKIEDIKNGLIDLYLNHIDTLDAKKVYAKNFSYRYAAKQYSKLIDDTNK